MMVGEVPGGVMSITVTIDLEECTGSSSCAMWLPEVFVLTDDGLSSVADPAAASEEEIVRVARACPARAIHVWSGEERLA